MRLVITFLANRMAVMLGIGKPTSILRRLCDLIFIMFVIYIVTLLILVYIAPAIALYPRMILSSRTAIAVPIVSIAVIGVAQVVFVSNGLYTKSTVVVFSAALLLVAVVRLVCLLRGAAASEFYWPASHRILLIVSVLLGMYWGGHLATTGFDTHDEIYSWNLWAIQHYLNQDIDWYYVKSPYPQLFPVLISFCYKLLGSIELQLPVRALFALFPISLWGAIAIAPKESTVDNAIRSVAVMLLLAVAIGTYFETGLADPLMATSLVVAISLYIQYVEEPDRAELLFLSLICSAVACYTKQAALVIALSLPVITLIKVLKGRLPLTSFVGAIALLTLALVWVLGPGSGFYDNTGVITRSQQDRDAIEQIIFAAGNQFAEHPLVPLFLALGAIGVVRAHRHRDIFLLFLVPATLAWLLYGSYSLRLGMHIVAASALLLAATDYNTPALPGAARLLHAVKQLVFRRGGVLLIAGVALFGTATVHRIHANIGEIGKNFSPYLGGMNTITKIFGKDARFVFEELYDRPDLLIWAPSNYIYGIFYGHTPVMRPGGLDPRSYTQVSLLDEIRLTRPDYLFDSGPEVAFGPGYLRLRELADECPELFEKRVTPPNKSGYTVYQLRKHDVLIDNCRTKLNN